MRQYEIAFLEKKNSRRTIADALEMLEKRALFQPGDKATILTRPLRLPSNQIVQLISVFFDDPLRKFGYVVPLPSAFRCLVTNDENSERRQIAADCLDCATVEADCTVRLASGKVLRAVEVIPALLPIEPSDTDWRIVHCAISALGFAPLCYRDSLENLPVPDRYALPQRRMLDFGVLGKVWSMALKPVAICRCVEYSVGEPPRPSASPKRETHCYV